MLVSPGLRGQSQVLGLTFGTVEVVVPCLDSVDNVIDGFLLVRVDLASAGAEAELSCSLVDC
jgi:hypothetical protein